MPKPDVKKDGTPIHRCALDEALALAALLAGIGLLWLLMGVVLP